MAAEETSKEGERRQTHTPMQENKACLFVYRHQYFSQFKFELTTDNPELLLCSYYWQPVVICIHSLIHAHNIEKKSNTTKHRIYIYIYIEGINQSPSSITFINQSLSSSWLLPDPTRNPHFIVFLLSSSFCWHKRKETKRNETKRNESKQAQWTD